METQSSPLVCKAHTTQYIIVLIVGLLVGAGASFVYLNKAPAPMGTENTYQAGFDAAKKLVTESPMGMMFRTPDDIRSISGTVTSVSGNRITIHTQSVNPFDDPAFADRTIIITTTTKITKTTPKDPKVFQAEMDTFMKALQSGKGAGVIQPPTPPQPTTVTTFASDIKVGDTLTATATENIKTMKEFSASEIQIQ